MALAVLAPTARAVSHVPAPVSATRRVEAASTVVVLQGEADLSATPILSDVFARVIAERTGDVIVDMGQVEFIDTAGVPYLGDRGPAPRP